MTDAVEMKVMPAGLLSYSDEKFIMTTAKTSDLVIERILHYG